MANMSLTTATNLFKIKYGKLSDNVYNSYNVLLGRVKKSYEFTGKRMDVAVPTSFIGGVGSGSLPTANFQSVEDAQITAKKMYAVVQIDRESIKASQNDEGAFVRLTKHVVKQGVESWMRNMSRTLFNDSTGVLGQFSGSQAGTASAPVVTVLTTGSYAWNEANFEERDFVNVNSLSSVFEITAVSPSTNTITLSRVSGSDDLTMIGAGTHSLYMQNSRTNDPQGLKGVCDATSSTLYAVNVARRWQSYQKDASSAGLTTDMMNEVMLGIEKQCGKTPKMIVTSYTQYRKLLNLLEDQKQYVIEPRSSDLKGKVSFKGVEFMSSQGAIGVFPDRFVDADRMYFLNDDYIEIYHRPDFGWFDDDGTVFLRTSGDAYEARYGGYLETYIVPSFQGRIKGLAT
jgi:hypothetical protein